MLTPSHPMSTLPARLALLLALAATPVLLLACGDDGGGDDDDTMEPDAGPLMSELFDECNVNSDCVEYDGVGPARCLPADLGFAEGACSRRCDGGGCRDNAGRSHICLDSNGEILSFARTAQGIGSFCYQLCGNSNDCAPGHSCIENTCIPWSCGEDGACAGEAICGPSGICSAPDAINDTGRENGEVCGGNPQCQSDFCAQPPFGAVTRCTGNCMLPFPGYNDINFYEPDVGEPMELPAGTCAGDTVCIPVLMNAGFIGGQLPFVFAGGSVGQQDPGRCAKACQGDADCGTGEYCANDIQVGTDPATAETRTYTKSFCVTDPRG